MLGNKNKNIIKESGLFPDEFTKEVEEDLSSYLEETKRLEESFEKRKKENEKSLKYLPKGFTFMVGNFEITT